MNVKENVLRRVFEHAEFVNKQYKDSHVRFFTALQGSQNYQLDDDNKYFKNNNYNYNSPINCV